MLSFRPCQGITSPAHLKPLPLEPTLHTPSAAGDLARHISEFRKFLVEKSPQVAQSWLTDVVAVEGWVERHGIPSIRPTDSLLPMRIEGVPSDTPSPLPEDTRPVIHLEGHSSRRVALVQETRVYPHLSWVRLRQPQLLLAATLAFGLVPVTEPAWVEVQEQYQPEQVRITQQARGHYPWLKTPALLAWERIAAELPDWLNLHGHRIVVTDTAPGPRGGVEILRLGLADGSAFEVSYSLTGNSFRCTGRFRPNEGFAVVAPTVTGSEMSAERIFPDEWFFPLRRRVMGLQSIRA